MSDEEAQKPLTDLLAPASIRLDAKAVDRDDAIRQAGAALVAAGAVDPSYVDAMLDRVNSVSTFVGEGFAFPHGTLAGKDAVKDDAIVVLRFPDGVDWDGNPVSVAVGIAAKGNGH
ncbi:MAG: PTS sugar transporter subunit IIA, partial [Pseudolysinimonas sp.]